MRPYSLPSYCRRYCFSLERGGPATRRVAGGRPCGRPLRLPERYRFRNDYVAHGGLSRRLLPWHKREIDGCGLSRLHVDHLRLRSHHLVPRLHRLLAGRYVRDREYAIGAADGEIRMLEDADVGGHPRVVVAANAQELAALQLELERHALERLRRVEVVAGHRRRVHVVLRRIVVLYLQGLPDARRDHARHVLAILLIEDNRHRRWRCRRKRSIEIHEHVRERSVRTDDEGRGGRTLADIQLVTT